MEHLEMKYSQRQLIKCSLRGVYSGIYRLMVQFYEHTGCYRKKDQICYAELRKGFQFNSEIASVILYYLY